VNVSSCSLKSSRSLSYFLMSFLLVIILTCSRHPGVRWQLSPKRPSERIMCRGDRRPLCSGLLARSERCRQGDNALSHMRHCAHPRKPHHSGCARHLTFGPPSAASKPTWTPLKTELSVLVQFSPEIAVSVLKPTQAYKSQKKKK